MVTCTCPVICGGRDAAAGVLNRCAPITGIRSRQAVRVDSASAVQATNRRLCCPRSGDLDDVTGCDPPIFAVWSAAARSGSALGNQLLTITCPGLSRFGE